MDILIALILLSAVGLVLMHIFQKSEQDAAEPVEPPTKDDLIEGNVSPSVPVIEDDTPLRR